MTALALDVRELCRTEIEAVAGGGIEDIVVPPVGPWVPGQPVPTGTGPYGGDTQPKIPA